MKPSITVRAHRVYSPGQCVGKSPIGYMWKIITGLLLLALFPGSFILYLVFFANEISPFRRFWGMGAAFRLGKMIARGKSICAVIDFCVFDPFRTRNEGRRRRLQFPHRRRSLPERYIDIYLFYAYVKNLYFFFIDTFGFPITPFSEGVAVETFSSSNSFPDLGTWKRTMVGGLGDTPNGDFRRYL